MARSSSEEPRTIPPRMPPPLEREPEPQTTETPTLPGNHRVASDRGSAPPRAQHPVPPAVRRSQQAREEARRQAQRASAKQSASKLPRPARPVRTGAALPPSRHPNQQPAKSARLVKSSTSAPRAAPPAIPGRVVTPASSVRPPQASPAPPRPAQPQSSANAAPMVYKQRRPQVRAALAYALPLAPALLTLLSERENRFIRLHAALALVFFSIFGVGETLVFITLVVLGGIVHNDALAVALGVISYGVGAALGIGSLILWLRFIADAIGGVWTVYPALSSMALRVERLGRARSIVAHS